MKSFAMDVAYDATVTERTIVRAETKEEAIQKVKDGDIDDVLDSFIETGYILDIDIFQVDEVEEC